MMKISKKRFILITFFSIFNLLLQAQSSSKRFEEQVLNQKPDSSILLKIFERLDNNKIVTWNTLLYVIQRLPVVQARISFIDTLLKYDFWDNEVRLKLVKQKLFYFENHGEELSFGAGDSLFVTTSEMFYTDFQNVYYKALKDYSEWQNLLGNRYLKTFGNRSKADSAFIEVLSVPFYHINDAPITHYISDLHLYALRGRLSIARGSGYKLKNIAIPFTFHTEIFPLYKSYMEEVGEKVTPVEVPKFRKN